MADINKLLATFHAINTAAKTYQCAHEASLPDNKDLRPEEIQKHIDDLMIITVGVWGTKGEYIAFRNATEIKTEDLPRVISQIHIENYSNFKFYINRNPLHECGVLLDCTLTHPFDLSISATSPTPNRSELRFMGVNETWVEGAYSQILACFEGKIKKSAFIHNSSVYDLLLWVGFVPMLAIYMAKLDIQITHLFKNYSQGYQFFIYLVLFLFCLLIFRVFFGILRWLFPHIEVIGHSNPRPLAIRTAVIAFGGLIWAGAVYDFAKWCSEKWLS